MIGSYLMFIYRGVIMGGVIVANDGTIATVQVNNSLYEVRRENVY